MMYKSNKKNPSKWKQNNDRLSFLFISSNIYLQAVTLLYDNNAIKAYYVAASVI